MPSETKIERTALRKGLKCTRIRKVTRLFLQEKPRAGSESATRCFRRSARDRRGTVESRTAWNRSLFPRGRLLRDSWTSKKRSMSLAEFFFFLLAGFRHQNPRCFSLQIADTPQEIPFLSILQHLLRLDPKDAASDLAWDTAETLVHRATLLENREDATKLLRSPSLQVIIRNHLKSLDFYYQTRNFVKYKQRYNYKYRSE